MRSVRCEEPGIWSLRSDLNRRPPLYEGIHPAIVARVEAARAALRDRVATRAQASRHPGRHPAVARLDVLAGDLLLPVAFAGGVVVGLLVAGVRS
jgi:hypothetical protein